jgi:ribosomal protein S18 acetylase RimI-like enzyme
MLTSPSELNIANEPERCAEVSRTIFDELFRSNVERTGDGKLERVCIVARDRNRTLVAGIYGEVYWGWFNILALWVAPEFRRKGLGSDLLARAEAEAVVMGCRSAYLDTFSFQDYGLYVRAGYEIFGELEHFPGDHSRRFLRKKLHAA